ncbi:hypothetical protein V1525DRAFT_404725 [Lipomyces kononenkoae]|uniref:Uncharacterized protein n=1 Tax=Lipomyces kononenkoae TaxID=34357 RepID=A0ACC3SZS5_LIPKO
MLSESSMMAGNLFSWVLRPGRTSPTMAQPSQRTLWCAFSDDLQRPFSVDCTVGVDTIDRVKKKICDMDDGCKIAHWKLDLYSPVNPVKGGLIKENLAPLHPRKRILSDFPQTNDPDLDIIILRPQEQQQLTAPRGSPELNEHMRANICTRDETVSKLAEILDAENIVHIRGTPASGKSVLALLLRDYYRRQGRTVFWLGAWEQNLSDLNDKDPWERFAQILRCRYPTFKKEQDIFANDNVIILDEAQGTYGDIEFWDQIVKSIRGRIGYRIKLCLFCSYGSPSRGMPYNRRDHGTPVDFGPTQRISLTPSVEPGSPPIGLFYNKDEFEIVVTKSCSAELVEKYSIDRDARNYIFNLTNGHPGAVNSIVYYLFQVYRSEVKHGITPTITENSVIQALADDNKVFSSLQGTAVSRSFPFGDGFTVEAANTLRQALEDGYIPFNESVDGIRCCYENGWIHRAVLRDSNEQQKSVGVLPSRLHEKYIECLIAKVPTKYPDEAFPTIQSLCKEVLKHFSSKNLRHCVEGKLSTAAKLRPLEAQYQDEFYRAFNAVVGRGVPISSEWSRKGDGRVDFWIPQKRWGIELLRDHNRVTEHCDRFKKGGRYYPWIEGDMLEDWIIIDCATSLPANGA